MLRWIRGLLVGRDQHTIVTAKQKSEVCATATQQRTSKLGGELTTESARLPVPTSKASVSLARAYLGTLPQRRVLRRYGLYTVDDLNDWREAGEICASAMPAAMVKVLRLWCWAIVFASKFEGMRPGHAVLLRAIHRRSPRQLRKERPAVILQDLRRFLRSSAGRKLWGDRPEPTLKEVQDWVGVPR